ncbi:hypothetical protein SOVF_059480 [Spinacia oleracea]|uniref:DUF8003 domain-containing protein n=1 Tax=Spinacia oleracea TaxID=3562 RepID=A0A9R0IEV5_SPIOL|nr:uncharacterized protein LOC110787415 [Spinacia oleracea]KNA19661.1 hypothetical protein SOVF_059480 [Spinacia oleracea]
MLSFRCSMIPLLLLFVLNPGFLSPPIAYASSSVADDVELSLLLLSHHDYSPPSPPPPPPHPPTVSCEGDLDGVGSLDTTCQIVSDLNLTDSVYIQGAGNFFILPNVKLNCSKAPGCEIAINITGNFSLGENSTIIAGTFDLDAWNASFSEGSVINTTGLAGDPPPQTSGSPALLDGSGGGHGGRGACCMLDNSKSPEDYWGGDTYSWSTLDEPRSYGSKGGTTSKEVDYGGGGGGRVRIRVKEFLVVNAQVLADGGEGGNKGGGGSGGSIHIKAHKMSGDGKVSACGGNGFGGGGGGRVSIDVFSWHDEPDTFSHGGNSYGCSDNAGGAGTLFDAVPRSLFVSNHNRSTDTNTLLMDFPNQPLWTNVYVRNHAKASVPLLWSRVQVQGQIKLEAGGELSFGLAKYASSEFELMAEELLMSDSVIKVYGALRMSVKMFLMWNSRLLVDGGADGAVATSLLEASNLLVLRESSSIHSNANLGVHGQGLLNLTGPGDVIEAQRLVLSLFYGIHIGPGAFLRGPLKSAKKDDMTPSLYCDRDDCPKELLHPPEDCNVNSSLSFTLQVCRVEDVIVEGAIEGSVVHFHRARTINVRPFGTITASGLGCSGGIGRGKVLSGGLSGGGGHGGNGGAGCHGGTCVEGGVSYGSKYLPCELGSGSGNDSLAGTTAGGGIVVMGSMEHPLSSLSVEGSLRADGGSYQDSSSKAYAVFDSFSGGLGGGSGGTVLLFMGTLTIGDNATLSSVGGNGGPLGGGGGAGGRVHFHWSEIPSGDLYQPIARVGGRIATGGGSGVDEGGPGENGTVTGKACPRGLYGIFCKECPPGTYKDVIGSEESLCHHCPTLDLSHRAVYIYVRGGVTEAPCPYKCVSDRYHMPHCYTALEELIYTFGGPWMFGLILLGLLILLALVLSVARMRFVGVDELPGPAPTQHGSQIDHSFPFLESLNEVLETNRAEESQSHVHRMYFMGPNSFAEPWHLPHSPPEQLKEVVYEGAFNRFVDEVNILATYQWWEGSVYSILGVLVHPLAWSWQQWRRRIKLQRLREFVRSEYDHACLRSCRSRALYEGIKVAATPDLMLAYVDFFLGGDEKRSDLPPRLHQRCPLAIHFGGDGSYMSPFTLHSDNILTSLMSQSVPPTTWYRLVAGLNAHLRLVRRGCLRKTFRPVLRWLESHAHPKLKNYGLRIDLAWFQATACGYCQYGLLVYAVDEDLESLSVECPEQPSSNCGGNSSSNHWDDALLDHASKTNEYLMRQKKSYGAILDIDNIRGLEEKRDIFFPFSLILHNTKPVGHQDLVGLVISILLLGDFSLVLLTLLQLYSVSMVDVFLVLLILPLGILLPFPAGINALFSHGPRRSAGLARLYALWNITSLVNVVVAFVCGYIHYKTQASRSKMIPYLQPWGMDEGEWWIFPVGLLLCKCLQSRLINWHVANLEIQDRSLYSSDFDVFWQS